MPERRGDGRDVGRAAQHGRGDARLQGLDRGHHRAARHPVLRRIRRPLSARPSRSRSRRRRWSVPPRTTTRRPTRRTSVAGRWYQQKFGDDLHGIYVFGNDSQAARDAHVRVRRRAARHRHHDRRRLRPVGQGDAERVHRDRPGDEEQRLELRAVHLVVPVHRAAAQGGRAPGPHRREGLGLRRRRATTRGSSSRVARTSRASTSTRTFLPFLSKADQKANPMTAAFVKYTGTDNAASFGAYDLGGGHRVPRRGERDREGRRRQRRHPQDDPGRTVDKIHKFDAEGMIAPDRPRRSQGHRSAT